jgi:hypothetical protein
MEAVEPTRRIIMRRGGQQQQQQLDRSSTWPSFAFTPSWIQTGIQTLKQSVFGPSNSPLQEQQSAASLLGKRSEPADDRDPGPTPKRPRRQSPPPRARSDSLEPQPSSVCPLLNFPLLVLFKSLVPLAPIACPLLDSTKHPFCSSTTAAISFFHIFSSFSDLVFHDQVHNEATEPTPHASMPTLPRTRVVSQTAHRSSPVTGPIPGRPLGPALSQNYLPNASTSRRYRLSALSGRPATATFASNNAIPPRAASQVGLGREYSFQGYRAVSNGPPSNTDTDRTSPSRQQSTVTRPKQLSRAPSFGPNPVRTPKSGHVFGKGRSTSPTKPTLDRPAGTGWASGIVRTERERTRLGSFANIPYEVRVSAPFHFSH